MRFIVSYTYLTEGGNRQYVTEVVDVPRVGNISTLEQHAFLYIRNEVSSGAVLLGAWPASTLSPAVLVNATEVYQWKV